MPRGDKSAYTSKQKRKAEHIEEGYEKRGVSRREAERRAWATVNKEDGGGKKSGSGRGKKSQERRSERRQEGRAASRSRPRPARARKGADPAPGLPRLARGAVAAAQEEHPAGAAAKEHS